MRSRVSTFLLCLFVTLPAWAVAQQPADQLGEVSFPTSCADDVGADFNRAVALLHSFEFEESRGVFTSIAERDMGCAMAHWGVAMTYYHPLWAPPSESDLEFGSAAATKAHGLPATEREEAYVEAIAAFYRDYETLDHRTRARVYEDAMAEVNTIAPEDREAEIFYLLAILSNADPTDKTYAVQKRTGGRAEELWAEMPNHPGLVHYIIHSYDYPPLADDAVEAAHRYLEIASALPHALHMSSHIFTQVGLWDESIHANTLSAEAARERGKQTGALAQAQLAEMHALDYLAYAYLQQGRDEKAREVLDHINAIEDLNWKNGVVAFNAGAVSARYTLERRRWEDAAALPPPLEAEAAGGDYQTRALVALRYWARAVGAARSGDTEKAEQDIARLEELAAELHDHPNVWARNTSEVFRLEATAWLALAQGEDEQALELMRSAAALEDETDKSSLSPGRVLPVHEQLGDMLMELGHAAEAQQEYEVSLSHARERFNSIYGAGRAAQAAGDVEAARGYYEQLLELTVPDSPRVELEEATEILAEAVPTTE
jgi:tetratricopeptide (TPR) repeat protein